MKEKRLQKNLLLVLALLILLASCSSFSFAAEVDADKGSSLISEENLKQATKKETPAAIKEIEETVKKYDLDKKDNFGPDNIGATVGYMLSSTMYKASRGMGYYGAYLTKFSIDFDLFTKSQAFLSKPFAALKMFTLDSFGGKIGLLFIACTLAVVVFLLIKGQVAAGFGKLFQILAVMLIAMFFFTEPLPFLRDANALAKQFGLAVFEYTQEGQNGTDAAVKTVWDTVAVNPWLLLEFDDMSASVKAAVDNDEKEEYKLKHLKPEDDERQDAVDALADTYRPLESEWSPQSDRMGTAFLLMLMNLVLFLLIVAINLFTLGLQVLALVLGLLTPFVFILALFPSKGMNVIKQWALALLGAYMGIALSLFGYGIFLMLLNLVYGQLMAELGVFLSFMVILSFILIVWIFRHKIWGIFGDTSSLDRFESKAEKTMMRMYIRKRNPGNVLPARMIKHVGRLAGRSEGKAADYTRRKAKETVHNSEFSRAAAVRNSVRQTGKNAGRHNWKDSINISAEPHREFYSQQEQAEHAEQFQQEAQQQFKEAGRAAASKKELPGADKRPSQDTDCPESANFRKAVRQQVQATERQSQGPHWEKDEYGIPYRSDSHMGQTMRKQAKERMSVEAGLQQESGSFKDDTGLGQYVEQNRMQETSPYRQQIEPAREGLHRRRPDLKEKTGKLAEKQADTVGIIALAGTSKKAASTSADSLQHHGAHSAFQLYAGQLSKQPDEAVEQRKTVQAQSSPPLTRSPVASTTVVTVGLNTKPPSPQAKSERIHSAAVQKQRKPKELHLRKRPVIQAQRKRSNPKRKR